MSDSVGLYLNEIGLVPLLTAMEERELSQVIERGREAATRLEAGEKSRELRQAVKAAAAAKDRFIRANLRLVVSIARRYPMPPGMELLDLIQEGNLGLEHAVDKFDWRKGFKFSTYATFWIRQAIGRALDQKASLVRLPGDRSASLRAALRAVAGDSDELDDEHARLHRLTTPTSLDRPVGDDDGSELIDLIGDPKPGPEDLLLDREQDSLVTGLLDVLEPRARYAVEQRFGIHDGRKRSYREVGDELGVTAEAARRLVKRAVNTVREEAASSRRRRLNGSGTPHREHRSRRLGLGEEVQDQLIDERRLLEQEYVRRAGDDRQLRVGDALEEIDRVRVVDAVVVAREHERRHGDTVQVLDRELRRDAEQVDGLAVEDRPVRRIDRDGFVDRLEDDNSLGLGVVARVELREQPVVVEVRADQHLAAHEVRPLHRCEQRDDAPIAPPDEMRGASDDLLEKRHGLGGHLVVVERSVRVRRATVAPPVERKRPIPLRERRQL